MTPCENHAIVGSLWADLITEEVAVWVCPRFTITMFSGLCYPFPQCSGPGHVGSVKDGEVLPSSVFFY